MSVRTSITDGPLPALPHPAPVPGGSGALLTFEGIVRGTEDERSLTAIDYQTYDPMAQTLLTRLAAEVSERHGLSSIIAQHSRGRVAVGEVSFRLIITAPHRKPALAAMDEFIDRMKQDVPIWKQIIWA